MANLARALCLDSFTRCAVKSGAQAHAVQTLRELVRSPACAKRLDCVRFSPAFEWPEQYPNLNGTRFGCAVIAKFIVSAYGFVKFIRYANPCCFQPAATFADGPRPQRRVTGRSACHVAAARRPSRSRFCQADGRDQGDVARGFPDEK